MFSVSYCRMDNDDLFIATTFTLTVELTPPLDMMVIVALPVPTAVTTPLEFTFATRLLSEANFRNPMCYLAVHYKQVLPYLRVSSSDWTAPLQYWRQEFPPSL